MNSSLRNASLVLLIIVLPLLSHLVNGNATLIEQTCNQTASPNLCYACIEPDPRSRVADFQGLMTILFGCGCNQALMMANYAKKQSQLASDVHMKDVLNGCTSMFFQAATHIMSGNTAIHSKNFTAARDEVSCAENQMFSCLDQFRHPLLQPRQHLLIGMLEFQGFCQIVMKLFNDLG